jgi:hypothetical protein
MGSRFGIRSLIWMSSGVLLVVTAVSVMFLLGIIAVLERPTTRVPLTLNPAVTVPLRVI